MQPSDAVPQFLPQYAVNSTVGKPCRLETRLALQKKSSDAASPQGIDIMRSHVLLLLSLLCFGSGLMGKDGEEGAGTLSYYEMKPSLVANLASGGKYIRTDIQLMTKDEKFLEQLDLHGPAIRHTLLLLLSEQDGINIRTAEGKENLRQQALTQINDLMQELSGQAGPEALFFTTFFVQ
jgi:flagellar FliL protein